MQRSHSASFVDLWIKFLIALIVSALLVILFIQLWWPAIAAFIASHWLLIGGVVIALAIGGTAHKTVPAGWRMFRAVSNHKDEKRLNDAYYNLLTQAKTQMANGYDIDLTNSRTGDHLKVNNPFARGRGGVSVKQIEELIEEKLALPAPAAQEQIERVVRYAEVADQVPSELSLLGIHPASGNLEIVSPDNYKTTWFVGGSNTGKTNTVYGKVADAVRWGARLIICDNHAHKNDSLANKLKDFHGNLLIPIAQTDMDIKDAILLFLSEFKRRRDYGAACDVKWLIVCDEVNATCEHMVKITDGERDLLKEEHGIAIKDKETFVKLKVFFQALAQTCGYESRGFEMFGYFISQKVAGLSWLRNAMMTVFVHGLLMDSEALLAANNDRKLADLVKSFKKGRTLVYGYEFEQPMILQQPKYEIREVVEADPMPSLPSTPRSVASDFQEEDRNTFFSAQTTHFSTVNTGELSDSGKWLDERLPNLPDSLPKLPENEGFGQSGKGKDYLFTEAEKPILINLYNRFHSIEECLKTMKKGARYHKDASRILKDAGLL